jgi:hypothetical protein
VHCQPKVIAVLAAFSVSFAPSPATADDSAMKLFAVEIKTGPTWDSAKAPNEQAFFAEHSANLKRLRDAGHIVMGARYSDIGLIVFSARSADEVSEYMDRDPSMAAGTFVYEVHALTVFYSGKLGTAAEKPH